MSSFTKMTLGQALSQIEELFESFGTKSIIIKKGNEWINVATIIQLTRRKVDDLSNEYRFLEEKLGKIDEDTFKIILQAKPVQDFKNVVTELQTGYLKIGEIRTKLLIKNPEVIANQRIGHVGGLSQIGEYAEYTYYGVTMGMESDVFCNSVSDLQVFASSMGFRDQDELVQSWLGLFSFFQSNTFYILIPIYVAVGEIQYQGGNEIKVTLKLDQKLFEDSTVWLTRSPQGDRAPIAERKKYELASSDKTLQDGFIYVTIKDKFSSITANDRIMVSLSNSKLDLLAKKEGWVQQFPQDASDPFLKVFSLFDAGKKMEEHLLNPKESGDLVAAFSWLLEMINIKSLQLQLGQGESVREDKAPKGSADIIACYYGPNSSTILAIDCTIGVPGTQKIDRIKNTAEYLSRKIGFPVKALIVTSANSSSTKEQGQKHSVKIIDSTDLDKMIGFYKKGHAPPARQIIIEAN
jgi:hypothetical protein